MKLGGAIIVVAAVIGLGVPASAEPTNRWWSGAGMGDLEYGYSGSDGSTIYIACDSERTRHSLRVSIRGIDPRPNSDVILSVDGENIRFWTTSSGDVEMNSHASLSSLYYLFDRLREGKDATLRFNGLSRKFSLAESARGLGAQLCGDG